MSRLACSRRPASLQFGTQTGRLYRPWFVSLTSVHPGCSQRLGRFFIVTPRLFATAGFAPIRNKTGWLRPPGFYSSLRSIQPAHDGSDASKMSCLSPLRVRSVCHASQPAAVPRLPCDSGQTRSGCARPGLCPSLQSIRGAAGFGRFGSSLRLRANPVGLCPPWVLPFAPVHPSYSGGSALLVKLQLEFISSLYYNVELSSMLCGGASRL